MPFKTLYDLPYIVFPFNTLYDNGVSNKNILYESSQTFPLQQNLLYESSQTFPLQQKSSLWVIVNVSSSTKSSLWIIANVSSSTKIFSMSHRKRFLFQMSTRNLWLGHMLGWPWKGRVPWKLYFSFSHATKSKRWKDIIRKSLNRYLSTVDT